MMPLVARETMGGLRKNQNQKIKDPNLGLSQVLGTASIVVQIINVDNALHLEKL